MYGCMTAVESSVFAHIQITMYPVRQSMVLTWFHAEMMVRTVTRDGLGPGE